MKCFIRAGIDANWLLTGEGDMLLHKPRSLEVFHEAAPGFMANGHSEDAHRQEMGQPAEEPAFLQDFALVPFFDVEASTRNGSLADQELQTSPRAFRKDWLSQRGLEISKCMLITARGDSMEPTIYDGDLLLVDTRIDSIKDDSIYIAQHDHHLIVKRIQQALDGSLIIISDNQRYEKQIIKPEQAKEVKIAGRVRWIGHEI